MRDLQAWRERSTIDVKEIAQGSGVHVSSVYRIFEDGHERRQHGAAMAKICKFANVEVQEGGRGSYERPAMPSDRLVPAPVRDAVLSTWDGSAEHANRLASAILAIGPLVRSVSPRGTSDQ